MVKRLIGQETPGKPLSDDAICKMIADEGIDLARRTVAKYREMMNIPSSSQRRMQARLANIRYLVSGLVLLLPVLELHPFPVGGRVTCGTNHRKERCRYQDGE